MDKMINLLTTAWIPVRLHNGQITHIRPDQVCDPDNPPVAFAAPRADFNGALAQFLIGLLQTAYAPEDHNHWVDLLETPPAPDELRAAFMKYREAFNLDGEGARFMQDLEPFTDGRQSISALLIDAPGENTIKNNTDHFVKRGQVEALCPACAASALFTLQVNAPSGGKGHRTSIRGGGPLTTLVTLDPIGSQLEETLWRNLWLNVLPQNTKLTGNPELSTPEHIFPWLAPTRTSETNGGRNTTPEDVHPLQMYWAMPRRIRLDFESAEQGQCDLCGAHDTVLHHYFTKPYGINYTGAWMHPLSPHLIKNGTPIPLHPQPGGITYRHWMGVALPKSDSKTPIQPALVVRRFHEEGLLRTPDGTPQEQLRLWIFGYDMDNMKPRCWYETTFPLMQLPGAIRSKFAVNVQQMVQAAEFVAKTLHKAIKSAWFKRPGEIKGDTRFLMDTFYQQTETDFFTHLSALAQQLQNNLPIQTTMKQWQSTLIRQAFDLFDQFITSEAFVHADVGRIARAHETLRKDLNGKKLRTLLTLPQE